MARSLTTTPQKSITFSDPFDQPAFSVYTGAQGSGGFFTYSHRMELHDFVMGTEGYSEYRNYSSYAPEMLNNWSNQTEYTTTSTASSSSNRPSATNRVGYLGHQFFMNSSTKANKPPMYKGYYAIYTSGYHGAAYRDCGVLVNETQQNYAIFGEYASTSGTYLKVGPRTPMFYYDKQQTSNDERVTIPVRNASHRGGWGNICYNKKLRKLLVMESNASYTFRPVVWENVPDLAAIANNDNLWYGNQEQYAAHSTNYLQSWFNDSGNQPSATVYGASSGKPRNNGNEDNYRGIPVLCDNGKVVYFQMIPGSNPNAWVTRWNAPDAPSGAGQCEGNLRQFSGTTSYGVDQGAMYGVRWQVTSDGRYIAAYCPYYYYGSGMHIVFIRVSDGKFLYSTNTDTTYGHHICPIGKSSFMISLGYNTDGGAGLYTNVINMDHDFARLADGSNNSIFSTTSYILETPYYSTSYPAIIPQYYDTSLFTTSIDPATA